VKNLNNYSKSEIFKNTGLIGLRIKSPSYISKDYKFADVFAYICRFHFGRTAINSNPLALYPS
jgi:hypothetical protein